MVIFGSFLAIFRSFQVILRHFKPGLSFSQNHSLLRLEPYSTHFVDLQGGNFDLADRLFTSVKDGWDSASQRNTADVKELIPEFFYLPNFLRNENRFRFGEKQSGKAVDDVELPAWANGDPNEFIRIHRYALESPYVSAHLHHWIDLIFGVLQNGKGALDSDNLFHPLFYQSKHYDIFDIEDEMERTGIIGYISNFGQIPRQIFKRAHTEKRGPWNSLTRWFGVTASEEFSKFFKTGSGSDQVYSFNSANSVRNFEMSPDCYRQMNFKVTQVLWDSEKFSGGRSRSVSDAKNVSEMHGNIILCSKYDYGDRISLRRKVVEIRDPKTKITKQVHNHVATGWFS